MICASIQGKTLSEIFEILQDPYVEMAEIRFDLCSLSDEDVTSLFESSEKALIATYHTEDWAAFHRVMSLAAEAGARYVDVPIEAPVQVSKAFQKICRQCGAELIRSFHDYEATPDAEELSRVVGRAFRYGADIVKVCTMAKNAEDAARVLSLYDDSSLAPGSLLAFCMGPEGENSRVECIRRGAPFSFAALSAQELTAPGQLTVEQMHSLVYGEDLRGFYRPDLEVPCSKSFAQRAILAAALAEGTSHLRSYTPCDDSEAAIRLARQLGAKVGRRGTTLTISGVGPIKEPLGLEAVQTGESGLLTRLIIPILSAINGEPFEVQGKGTLLRRPLSHASDIMAAFGVMLSNASEHEGKDVFVPLKVKGSLVPGVADVPGQGGSQLISGLLMALPLCQKPSRLYVGEPKSIPYMFITLDVLKHFGVNVKAELEGNQVMLEQQDWSYCTGVTFSIRGSQHLHAADFDLEGDWSAAANFLVAGAIFGSAEVAGLDSQSLQADISIMDVLVEAGACVACDEEDGSVSVCKGPLEAFEVDLNNSPDIFPIVAVLAAFCPGVSEIKGVGRLRSKESDRGRAILEMLSGLGVRAQIVDDVLQVEGKSYASRVMNGRLLSGGSFTSWHDHRMAMALAIASIGAAGPVEIDDRGCVAKSFPDFFEVMA